MKYHDALKLWNSVKRTCNTEHCWIAPKKGTHEYDEVRFIMRNDRHPEQGEDLTPPKKERKKKEKAEKPAKATKKVEKKAVKKAEPVSAPLKTKIEPVAIHETNIPKVDTGAEKLKMKLDEFFLSWYLAAEVAKGKREISFGSKIQFQLAGDKDVYDLDYRAIQSLFGKLKDIDGEAVDESEAPARILDSVIGEPEGKHRLLVSGSNLNLAAAFGYLALVFAEEALTLGAKEEILTLAEKYDGAIVQIAKQYESFQKKPRASDALAKLRQVEADTKKRGEERKAEAVKKQEEAKARKEKVAAEKKSTFDDLQTKEFQDSIKKQPSVDLKPIAKYKDGIDKLPERLEKSDIGKKIHKDAVKWFDTLLEFSEYKEKPFLVIPVWFLEKTDIKKFGILFNGRTPKSMLTVGSQDIFINEVIKNLGNIEVAHMLYKKGYRWIVIMKKNLPSPSSPSYYPAQITRLSPYAAAIAERIGYPTENFFK
jgi:hypothetical protein